MEMRQKALEIQSGVVIVEKEATSPTARSVTMPETSTGLSRHELILFLCKYIVVYASNMSKVNIRLNLLRVYH